MNRPFATLAAVLLWTLTGCPTDLQRGLRKGSDTPEAAAEAAMVNVLPSLAEAEINSHLGFRTDDDFRTMKLEAGFPVFELPVVNLAAFESQAPIASLLGKSTQMIFPVAVTVTDRKRGTHRVVRSSVSVYRGADGWKPASYGGADTARALDRQRAAMIADGHLAPSSFFVIEVPALNIRLLAAGNGTEMELIPLADDRRFHFVAGKRVSAVDGFQAMRLAARDYKDLPD